MAEPTRSPIHPLSLHRSFMLALAAGAAFVFGVLALRCSPEPAPGEVDNPAQPALRPVVVQTDWLPQPEHGGLYQALALGLYEAAGLDVTLLPGGPRAQTLQQVLTGRADFGMNRADTLLQARMRGLPLVMVAATFQQDPQALLLHADDPATGFADLDGRRVMANPGLTWILHLQRRYGITLEIVPQSFGLERFFADPRLVQQCLLTHEPYHARRAGFDVNIWPLSESGFNPYHALYTREAFLEEAPEQARAFVAATLEGWRSFLEDDPTPAFEAIAAANPHMSLDFMRASHAVLRDQRLVTGDPARGEAIGQLDPERMQTIARQLIDLGLLPRDFAVEDAYTTRFLPASAKQIARGADAADAE